MEELATVTPLPGPLAALDQARAALEQAESLSEVKKIRDQAEAARSYVKAARLSKEMADRCAEIKLRAERRAGEWLAEHGPRHGGDRSSSHRENLNDLGISHNQSSRWQQVASVPEKDFEDYLATVKDSAGAELTSAGLLRLARLAVKAKRVADIAATPVARIPADQTFPVILADPPWRYDARTISPTRSIENIYPTLTAEELADLHVPAAEDAVLFLWATSPKLGEALDLISAWGFTYTTCAVWIKDRMGLGYHFRQQHELLLVAGRGNLPPPDPADRPRSVINAPRGEHSAKPTIVHEYIEQMYPHYRRCELFARGQREGWTSWGNQAGSSASTTAGTAEPEPVPIEKFGEWAQQFFPKEDDGRAEDVVDSTVLDELGGENR